MKPKKIIKSLSELPTMPSTIGTMEWNQTGDWRYLTPLVADKPAPCSRNCPAGIPIPDYLSALKQGDVQMALSLLLAYNPLPGLTGRLCYHPCQTECARQKIDGPISIREIERLLAELGTDAKTKQNKRSDKRVTVIGSGPLGLSCAFYLGCRGLQVTVLDVRNQAGGALIGLSAKKIESRILESEIGRLVRIADIHLETGAVLDFNKPVKSQERADLIILDPTGFLEESDAPAAAVPFNPLVDEDIPGDFIAVSLPENLKSFKAVMIAHYIAAGRLTAEKAFRSFIKRSSQGLKQPGQEPSPQAGKVEDIQMVAFLGSALSVGAGTKREGAREREQALQEAARCMSCGTCNLCLDCVSSCPEACIRLSSDKTAVTVNLDFCKGCGICAYECPREVITMEEINP